ncbi:MAG: hypothetical protein R3C26_22605 [Calditrichia bacterium]
MRQQHFRKRDRYTSLPKTIISIAVTPKIASIPANGVRQLRLIAKPAKYTTGNIFLTAGLEPEQHSGGSLPPLGNTPIAQQNNKQQQQIQLPKPKLLINPMPLSSKKFALASSCQPVIFCNNQILATSNRMLTTVQIRFGS